MFLHKFHHFEHTLDISISVCTGSVSPACRVDYVRHMVVHYKAIVSNLFEFPKNLCRIIISFTKEAFLEALASTLDVAEMNKCDFFSFSKIADSIYNLLLSTHL